MSFEYLLDSWAWFEYFQGSARGKRIAAVIEGPHRIATTIVVIAELADKFGREHIDFHQFLKFIKLRATLIPLTEELVLKAPEIKLELRKRHPDASLVDAINLAAARINKAKLLTGDSDFSGIPDAELV
jgi:predicted nucleic acid-binding protein